MSKKEEALQMAKFWLEDLRRGGGAPDIMLKYFRKALKEAGCTVEDIGTSEQELAQLLLKGFKDEARKHLDVLRKGKLRPKMREIFVICIHRAVAKAGCTLEDVGTNEEELQKLLRTQR